MKQTSVALFVENLDLNNTYGIATYNLLHLMQPLGYQFEVFTTEGRANLNPTTHPLPENCQVLTPFKSWGLLEITNFLVRKSFQHYDLAHCLLPNSNLGNLAQGFTDTLEKVWPTSQVLTTDLREQPFPFIQDASSEAKELSSTLELNMSPYFFFKNSELVELTKNFFLSHPTWKLCFQNSIQELSPSEQKFVYYSLQKNEFAKFLVSSESNETEPNLLFIPDQTDAFELQQLILNCICSGKRVLLSESESSKLPTSLAKAPGITLYKRGLNKAFESLCLLAEGFVSDPFKGLQRREESASTEPFLQSYKDTVVNHWNRLYSQAST